MAVGRVANGHIARLDFSGQMRRDEETAEVSMRALLLPALQTFLAAHAGTLRHLVLRHCKLSSEEALLIFQAAPREVEHVEMEVECFFDEAKPLLCREAPFETLHLKSLRVLGRESDDTHRLFDFPNESALSLARDLARCACLERLALSYAPLCVPLVCEALSVACLKLTKLTLASCGLKPRSVPGLVFLISEGCLTGLSITNLCTAGILDDDGDEDDDDDAADEDDDFDDHHDIAPLFDEPCGIAFGDALRANKTLISLELHFVRLWDVLPAAGPAVVNGIVGHPTLEKLDIGFNKVAAENRHMVGDVLGQLISVPSALTFLSLSHCELSDVGLRPLFQALPSNAKLCVLSIFGDCKICTTEFTAEVLEAVRQNTSLRGLGFDDSMFPGLNTAMAFVKQRLRDKRASQS